jgi:hypothetical protein
MSLNSITRAKAVVIAPNGERITRSEKLVLLNLADFANKDKGDLAWPSVPKLAELSLMSERQCRNIIRSLTRKRCITCEHRTNPANPTVNLTNHYRVIVGQELPQVGKKSAGGGEIDCPRGGEIAIAGEPVLRTVKKEPLIKPAADAAVVLCKRLSLTGKKNQAAIREVIELEAEKSGQAQGKIAGRMLAAWESDKGRSMNGGFAWPKVAFFTSGTWLETDHFLDFMHPRRTIEMIAGDGR